MNHAYGKVILVGEHFVVYDLPALVTALDFFTTAQLEKRTDNNLELIDNRPQAPTCKPYKTTEYHTMLTTIFTSLGLTPEGWTITLQGTLPVTNGGIGASAAAAVAIARALNNTYNLKLTDEQINEAAFCGEHAVHGTPSGIDNTAATYGGTFVFQKTQPRQQITLQHPLHLVLADSGRPTNTKLVLQAISALRAQNATAITHAFEQYLAIFTMAHHACLTGDYAALGKAMTNNHTLLAHLGLSSPEQDFLVALALKTGALGAKITGTGCGGLMIALAEHQEQQEKIAQAFINEGFYTVQTTPFTTISSNSSQVEARHFDAF